MLTRVPTLPLVASEGGFGMACSSVAAAAACVSKAFFSTNTLMASDVSLLAKLVAAWTAGELEMFM